MAALANRHELFMPRPPGGMGRGLVLALLVHGLLVAGLAIGVNWRTSSPTPLQAELWAAVPQVAAPRAAAPEPRPAPPPEPAREAPKPRPAPPERPAPVEKSQPDPQIAIEQARKERQQKLEEEREQDRLKKEAARKLELAKAEQAEKVRKAEADKLELAEKKRLEQEKREKDKERAEAARAADARAAAVRRMLEQAGGESGEAGSTGTAAQSGAPSAGYTGRVIARIKPNIVFVDNLTTNPEAEVLVRLAPDGRILSQKLTRSSGSREWDQAVQRAIERTEVLPRDTDGRVPASMVISFKPRE